MDFSFLLTRHPERAGQIFEEPRSILKRIPGVEVVEMTRNRMDARCCGGGAPSPFISPFLRLFLLACLLCQ